MTTLASLPSRPFSYERHRVETKDKIDNLNESVALRVIPELRQTRRIVHAILVWQIVTITVMLCGWGATLGILWRGVTHD